MNGSLDIILGCMFSGKTSELIMSDRRWSAIGKKVLSINYDKDVRYGSDAMYSHSLEKTKCIMTNLLGDIDEEIIKNADIILINEAQFFKDLLKYCVYWVDILKKHITVSGLDGDFERKPFGHILDLIPYCNSVKKITAYCKMCNTPTPAIFTHRITSETKQELIGSNNYIALCRYHYLELNQTSS